MNTWLVALIIANAITAVATGSLAYNHLTFSLCAKWNPYGNTVANNETVGFEPADIFVDTNNTLYVTAINLNLTIVQEEYKSTAARNLTSGLQTPSGLFVTNDGSIYISNGGGFPSVEQWMPNGTVNVVLTSIYTACVSLFIDVNNTLYCSTETTHEVRKTSLIGGPNPTSVAAGNGTSGIEPNMLANPRGIFVDMALFVYIADYNNDRVQRFGPNETNGTTLAGTGASGSITLTRPSDVVVDGNGFLFIVDSSTHRIIGGSVTYGFRCIIGCTGIHGSAADQLHFPFSLAFDNHGNILVNDKNNNRIQKFLLAANSCIPSYNRPKLCPSATWQTNAVTFANNATIGNLPNTVFVTTDNSVYIAAADLRQVQMWDSATQTLTQIFSGSILKPYGLFVSNNGDVYIDNFDATNNVERWTANGTYSTAVMNVSSICTSLAIDVSDYLYCSSSQDHVVYRTLLTTNALKADVIAGNLAAGSNVSQLNCPHGIFLNYDSTLFVADTCNDRIQRFPSGQQNASTVAGNGSTGTIALSAPTAVVLDADGYLFIADSGNHRIVASSAQGFRCIAACSGKNGSSANELRVPWSLSFDNHGNLFVTDRNNHRIQEFRLSTNLCGPSYNRPKLLSCTDWDTSAITFATVGDDAADIFVDTNNTVYIADKKNDRVLIWYEGSTTVNRTLTSGLSEPATVFATLNGDVYVDNAAKYGEIRKWKSSGTNNTVAANISKNCFGLFVDHVDNLYCSIDDFSVYRYSPYNGSGVWEHIAGSSKGSSSIQLNKPRGLFVDLSFNLYVADCDNNRVQWFPAGQTNATTVAGDRSSLPITLHKPYDVVLDAAGYLFIADCDNNRIVRSGPKGFQCLFGCTSKADTSSKLNKPQGLSFDTYGNLYVADQDNKRIQKFLLLTSACDIPYNQPKLCANATWDANGTTIANSSLIGYQPSGLFIDRNDSMYVLDSNSSRVFVWTQGSFTLARNFSGSSIAPSGVFAMLNGFVFIDNSAVQRRIDRWSVGSSVGVPVMYVSGSCSGFFVDTKSNIYCSLASSHVVLIKRFNETANKTQVMVGIGTPGATSKALSSPRGIFVDVKYNLYVADCGNNRVQFFEVGYANGTTLASNQSEANFTLDCPQALTIDGDGYLYVTDRNHHRIVRFGSDGWHCIIGCTGVNGSESHELNLPSSLSFDSEGNLFVIDDGNVRLQKFSFAKQSCEEQLVINVEETTPAETSTPQSPRFDSYTTALVQLSSLVSTQTTVLTTQAPVIGIFIPLPCSSVFSVGSYCNISALPCDISNGCINNSTCVNDNATQRGFTCSCGWGFNGSECQYDHRPCQTSTCWNNGICVVNASSGTSFCRCAPGWEDLHCQTKINYCANVTCLNRGICRTLVQDYQCQCPPGGSSGRHCEQVADRVTVLQIVSRSFASVAITAMTLAFIFVIVMDVLKYGFHIDFIERPRRWRLPAGRRRPQRPRVIVRFRYIDAPKE